MKTLAINTTNSFAEISVNIDGNIFSNAIKSPYSENIMTALQKTLSDSQITLQDIDAFGVVTGPGSFTGIRIGMSVLKGVLCGLNKPCVAINSFELVSYNINDNNFVVLLDSGNSDSYYAIFDNKKVLETGFGEVETIKEFATKNNIKVYYASEESQKFGGYENLNAVDVDKNTLSKIVFEKTEKNEFTSIETLSPVYIKLSQAEIGLEKQMKEHLHFETANNVDVNMLEIVDKQCFDEYERYSQNMFLEELNEKTKHYIVAKYDELVIGYVGVQHIADELTLLKIAVLPQYRKLGVGFKLMEKTFDFKKQNNIEKYFLEVRESNKDAIKLYQKFGFKTQSKREKYYDGVEDAVVMIAK